jgi:hypothetical protein
MGKYDPSQDTTPLSRGNYAFNVIPCCPKFHEMLVTGEFNIALPKYDVNNKPLLWYINTRIERGSNGSMNRWHRIAYCPYCGKHTSELKSKDA